MGPGWIPVKVITLDGTNVTGGRNQGGEQSSLGERNKRGRNGLGSMREGDLQGGSNRPKVLQETGGKNEKQGSRTKKPCENTWGRHRLQVFP